jgi:rod shape determining protein RodA
VLWAAIGLTAFLAVYALDFRFLVRISPFLYAAGILALAAVLMTHPVKGARSWFSLPGGVKVQPSEFMKPACALFLARWLAAAPESLRLRDLAAALAVAGLPVALVLRQPDMGTALTFMPMAAAAAFVGGVRLWQLGSLAGLGLAGGLTMWLRFMHGYQKTRIYAWLDPEPYKLEQAFQLIQSQIAVGSGGLWGKGLGMGTQNQFDLLPLKESDFIFAVIAEEGGFIRAGVLLLLLVLLVLSGMVVALRAADREGQILAATCTALLGGQALINIGVTLGLLPTTGITLPFVSYGGSSMLASFILAGLLASVHARPRRPGLFG